MAQHDYNIANQGFPATRADINNALAAIVSNNSGDTEPATTYANQWWYDSDANVLYIRNEANDAWITVLTLDQGNDAVSKLTANEIEEAVAAAGVTIDGLLVKDKVIGTTATPVEGLYAKAINGGQIGGRRNMLFNGDMRIWQRSTSTSYGSGTQNAYLTADRWKTTRLSAASVTQAQSTDAPDGFANSFGITVTTADGTLDAGDYEYYAQYLEGYDVQHLKYGTADAKPVTVSFWVKCSLTGDFVLNLYADGSSTNYSIGTTVTINSANTWEYKTVTFPGLTTDTIPNDNALRFGIFFYTTAGSTWKTTDNTSWDVYSYGRVAYGQTLNLSGTASATFKVAGFQLEAGSIATEFEHRSYGEELALCQRYYQNPSTIQNIFSGYVASGYVYYHSSTFPVEMRATPTMTYTIYATPNGFALTNPGGIGTPFGQYAFKTSTSTVNSGYYTYKYTADAEL